MLRAITVVMEIVAHGLWAAAAAITAKRSTSASVRVGWTVWWAAFPDVLAFGPTIAAGLWLRLAGGAFGPADGHVLPHVHVGLPLYPAGHSLIVFLLVFGIATILARRIVFEMLGWLMHILIDIPTHSFSYYATRFLWPVSDLPRSTALHGGRPGSGRRRTGPSRLCTFCSGREAGYRLSGDREQTGLYAGSAIWSKPGVPWSDLSPDQWCAPSSGRALQSLGQWNEHTRDRSLVVQAR